MAEEKKGPPPKGSEKAPTTQGSTPNPASKPGAPTPVGSAPASKPGTPATAGASSPKPATPTNQVKISNTEDGAISEKVQMIIITPIGDAVTKLKNIYGKDPLVNIYDVNSSQAAGVAKQLLPSIVMGSVIAEKDGHRILSFLKNIRDEIRHNKIKFILFTKVKNNQMIKQFEQFGCKEIVSEPINERSLKFKMDLHVKAAKAQRKNLRSKELQKKEENKTFKGDKKSQEQEAVQGGFEAKIKEVEYQGKSDHQFAFKGNKPRKQGRRWVVRVKGPSEDAANWVPFEKLADGSMRSRLVYAGGNLKDEQKKPGWEFVGEKPHYNAGEWNLAGEKLELRYVDEKGQKLSAKTWTDPNGFLFIAKDTPDALKLQQAREKNEQLMREEKKKALFSGKKKEGKENKEGDSTEDDEESLYGDKEKKERSGEEGEEISYQFDKEKKKESESPETLTFKHEEKKSTEFNYVDKKEEKQSKEFNYEDKKENKEGTEFNYEDKKEPESEALDYKDEKKKAEGGALDYTEEKKEAAGTDLDYTDEKKNGEAGALDYTEEKKEAAGTDLDYTDEKKKGEAGALDYTEEKKAAAGTDLDYSEEKKAAAGTDLDYREEKKQGAATDLNYSDKKKKPAGVDSPDRGDGKIEWPSEEEGVAAQEATGGAVDLLEVPEQSPAKQEALALPLPPMAAVFFSEMLLRHRGDYSKATTEFIEYMSVALQGGKFTLGIKSNKTNDCDILFSNNEKFPVGAMLLEKENPEISEVVSTVLPVLSKKANSKVFVPIKKESKDGSPVIAIMMVESDQFDLKARLRYFFSIGQCFRGAVKYGVQAEAVAA